MKKNDKVKELGILCIILLLIIAGIFLASNNMKKQIEEYKGNISQLETLNRLKPQCAQIRVLAPFNSQQPENGKPIKIYPCCGEWNINNQSDIVIEYNRTLIERVYQDNNFVVFKQIGNYNWEEE